MGLHGRRARPEKTDQRPRSDGHDRIGRYAAYFGSNGWRWRVVRTSNAYEFNELRSESEKPRGTTTPEIIPSLETAAAAEKGLNERLAASFEQLWTRMQRKAEAKTA
jgi:hypothetical protein